MSFVRYRPYEYIIWYNLKLKNVYVRVYLYKPTYRRRVFTMDLRIAVENARAVVGGGRGGEAEAEFSVYDRHLSPRTRMRIFCRIFEYLRVLAFWCFIRFRKFHSAVSTYKPRPRPTTPVLVVPLILLRLPYHRSSSTSASHRFSSSSAVASNSPFQLLPFLFFFFALLFFSV